MFDCWHIWLNSNDPGMEVGTVRACSVNFCKCCVWMEGFVSQQTSRYKYTAESLLLLWWSHLSLTYAVGQNDGQHHSHAHRDQGRALPRTMFGRLLELERPSGQAVSGKGASGCGVHRSCCHGVTRSCGAEERCCPSARFKEKMPKRQKKESYKGFLKTSHWNCLRPQAAL